MYAIFLPGDDRSYLGVVHTDEEGVNCSDNGWPMPHVLVGKKMSGFITSHLVEPAWDRTDQIGTRVEGER